AARRRDAVARRRLPGGPGAAARRARPDPGVARRATGGSVLALLARARRELAHRAFALARAGRSAERRARGRQGDGLRRHLCVRTRSPRLRELPRAPLRARSDELSARFFALSRARQGGEGLARGVRM